MYKVFLVLVGLMIAIILYFGFAIAVAIANKYQTTEYQQNNYYQLRQK